MAQEALDAATQRRVTGRNVVQGDDPVLAAITHRLAATLHPERIYLFGSRARGDADLDSDYDVLVLVPSHVDRSRRLAQTGYHALRGIDVAVDIVVMSVDFFERRRVVVASLPATIEREGKLLYAADVRRRGTSSRLRAAGVGVRCPATTRGGRYMTTLIGNGAVALAG